MNGCNPIPCDCVDGPQGPQGLKGPKGSDGVPGVQGPQGIQGVPGETGINGEIGDQGPQGETGSTSTGLQGPQGAIGPQGPQGIQGIDGVDGVDGTDGTDGVDDVDAWAHTVHTQYCDEAGSILGPNGCTECLACNFPFGVGSPTVGGRMHWNDRTGPGFTRVDLGSIGFHPLGARYSITGFKGASAFKLRAVATQLNSVEISGYNSTTDNVAFGGPTAGMGLNYPESGMLFDSPNGSDCIEVVHVGDDRWVIVKALLAGGLTPTVII